MKRLNIYLLSLALCGAAAAPLQAAERTVSYARQGMNVTLDLNWNADNYGTIQWQQSADGGDTWTDIPSETSPTYNFRISAPTLCRAVVNGDPSCPEAQIERLIQPVTFRSKIAEIGSDRVTISLSDVDFAGAEVTEYGFAANLTSLARPTTRLNRVKTGEGLPEGDSFDITCSGLHPASDYTIRPWFRTADGSFITGSVYTVTTKAGIAWNTEDWIIEKDRIRPSVVFYGDNAPDNITILFGPDRDNLTECTPRRLSYNVYNGTTATGLQPGTDYIAVARATIDGKEMEIEKTVRTWSDYSTFEVDNTSTGVHHTIKWDAKKTLVTLSSKNIPNVEYPRMCRVDDETILLSYHGGTKDHWTNSYLSKSTDNGQTWSDPMTIYNCEGSTFGKDYWRICNPEMTRLANGWIILTVIANGKPETNRNCKVLAALSKDGGETWSDPIIVGRGRTWEPQVVQLPNGELELLVSSEAAWWEPRADNVCQEIVSARSTDNGQTWTTFKRASFKPGARDGMPVAVVMQGNQGVLFIEESVNGGVPPTLQHRALDQEWETYDWDGVDDNRRWRTSLASGAGAPYCIQLPTGEFVIAAHTDQTGSVWQTCRPQIVMTDNTGHNFRYSSKPLAGNNPLPYGTGAYYNSLFLKDANTVWLLITRARYDGGTRKESSIMMLEGKVVQTR